MAQLRRSSQIGLSASLALAVCLQAQPDERAQVESQYREARQKIENQRAELATLREELNALEIKIEERKRFLPPAFEAAEEQRYFRETAGRAELPAFDAQAVKGSERLLLEGGRPSPLELYRLDVSGRGPYTDVLLFLNLAGVRARQFEVETMRIRAEAGQSVSFSARLALPCFAGWPLRTAARLDANFDPVALVRDKLAEQRLFLKALTEMAERSKPSRLVYALAAFEREAFPQALALREVRVGREVVLEGVLVGAGTRAGLEAALDKAGFELGGVKLSREGECQAFSASARLKPGDPPEEFVGGNGSFDERTATVCSPEPPPSLPAVAARGSAVPGAGLTMHLRDLDASDVFRLLHESSPRSFVIDPDVKGRLSVDFENATLDEALAALRSAGLVVGPGPLSRVSRASSAPAARATPAAGFGGQPVSVSFKDAELRLVAQLFGDLSGLKPRVPREPDARVSVYARELPWDQVLSAVASAAGLVAVVGPDSFFVGPEAMARVPGQPDAADPKEPVPGDSGPRLAWRSVPLPQLGTGDLALAGLVRAGNAWLAYGYGPRRTLWLLEPGQALFDGQVESVDASGATLRTQAGQPVLLALRP